METSETQTVGEKRVRVTFNPGQDENVVKIKEKTAELIDLVESIKLYNPRLAALAQTNYEEAAMWGVKLATTPEDERQHESVDR